MTPCEAANAVKQAVPMRQAAERYGFAPNRAGFICCPFHQEKTPSLKCYNGSRGFSCYGCGEHGSVIDFVQRLFNLNFWQAVMRLDTDFCLNLPLGRTMSLRERRQAAEADRKRREEQERIKRAALRAEEEYYDRFEYWRLMEIIAATLAPNSPEDEKSDLWIFAVKERTLAAEALEIADIARMKYAR